jgi:rhamnulokinase
MANSKFLAFDIGAESGRAIVGVLNNHKISLEEIHRFANKQIKILGHLHWDVLYLFEELKKGLSIAVKSGHSDIRSIGIDTWGVDFGLLGKNNELLGFPFTYRDSNTTGIMDKVFRKIPRKEIYSITGIQYLQFNSLFQLYSIFNKNKKLFNICETLLFIPDLLNFYFTGKKNSEYSIASTSQMLNAKTRKWDRNIFRKLGLPINIMPSIVPSGTILGKLLPEFSNEIGLKNEVDVVAVGCHDTASAVAAVPFYSKNSAFLSSGTWSIIGIESDLPIINKKSLDNNFSNEGGVENKIRFLTNVMGMWLMQETRKVWLKEGKDLSYDELIKMASTSEEFKSIINPDDGMFLNPTDMIEAIKEYCKKKKQPVPVSKGEIVRCILESLALKYKIEIEKINCMTEKHIETLHIVGGGSQNEMLNQFTADASGIPVIAGPVEATATGNILVQAIAGRKIKSIKEGRDIVTYSFPLKTYLPKNSAKWNNIVEKINF